MAMFEKIRNKYRKILKFEEKNSNIKVFYNSKKKNIRNNIKL